MRVACQHASLGRAVLRAEAESDCGDVLSWLRAQSSPIKIYWADRDGTFEAAGIGAADLLGGASQNEGLAVFQSVKRRLSGAPAALRYYGGMSFSARQPADATWRPFGPYWFVLPRFELLRLGDKTRLACHWVQGGDPEQTVREIGAELDALTRPEPRAAFRPGAASARLDLPDRDGWAGKVAVALQLLAQGRIEKIVLARRSTFEFAKPLDPLACLQALGPVTGSCYRFCFMPEPGVAFIGASPERLYCRTDRTVLSDAIAGTRSRGHTPDLDERLGNALLQSEKDLREHAYVVRGIAESLGPLCETVSPSDKVKLLKLGPCQHLMSTFHGRLKAPVDDADLLRALQPTAAVGGYPTRAALEEIDRIEPFERGWYAGPVGWMAPDAAEFAVAIRSALVSGKTISLYSGAGIVRDSRAEGEWDELENKISHYLRVLGAS